MGKVETLRSVAIPAARRSPERERLAKMVRRHSEAVADLDRIRNATERFTEETLHPAMDAKDNAIAALREAGERASNEMHLAAVALGEAVVTPIHALQRAADDATAAYDVAQQTITGLWARERAAEEEEKYSAGYLTSAVNDTVRVDPAMAALIERCARLQAEVAGVRALLGLTVFAHPPGYHFDSVRAVPALPEYALRYQAWGAALAALRLDPDAPLPME